MGTHRVILVLASVAAATLAGAFPAAAGSAARGPLAASGRRGDPPFFHQTLDGAGLLGTASSNGFDTGQSDGFFSDLGTNGRTCATCHVQSNAWTFTPRLARSLPRHHPLFSPNDGSDCPPTSPTQGPDKNLSSQVVRYGLIRVQIAVPDGADFVLDAATNPKNCAIPPASPGVDGQLFLFRRPLPSTNLVFDSAVMWDGRETVQPITTQAGFQDLLPLLFDLGDQANGATTGHAQGASIAGTATLADIVAFEQNLYTAQTVLLQPRQHLFAALDADGANGGPEYLRDTVAPAFAIGVNDPLKPGFTNAVFDVFAAWEPTSSQYARLSPSEQAIGRGEAVFNQTTFVIHDVPGLNSAPGDPLYNPNDPLAGQDIVGGCGVCHNSPNVGNHSTALAINIGTTMAQPTNNDGSPNAVLDIANLPVYTLRNPATGAVVEVTDPGRALITGRWVDIGKTKGPNLRGLAGRAPYLHNGSAKDLAATVEFYDQRFAIGLTPQQKSDLVAFLNAL
jgi:hypothetical protein